MKNLVRQLFLFVRTPGDPDGNCANCEHSTVGQVANYLPKKYSLSEHDFYSFFDEIFVFYLENFQNSQIFEVGADFQKILPKLSEKSHPPENPYPFAGQKVIVPGLSPRTLR